MVVFYIKTFFSKYHNSSLKRILGEFTIHPNSLVSVLKEGRWWSSLYIISWKHCLSNSRRQIMQTWKVKPLYDVSTFLPTWFFSAISKVENYQNKTGEKSLYQSKYVLTKYFKGFQRYFQIHMLYFLYL